MLSVSVDVWLLCLRVPWPVCAMCIAATYKVRQKRHSGKKIELFVPYFSEPILSSHRLQCSGDCLCLFWRRPLCTESVSIYSVVLLSFQIAVNIGPVGNCSKISDTDVVKMGRMN